MGDVRVEITELDQATVLAALYNNTLCAPAPFCQIQDIGEMSIERAKEAIRSHGAATNDNRVLSFDYVYGRPIKVSFEEDDDGKVWIERADLYERDSLKTVSQIVKELSDGLQASA